MFEGLRSPHGLFRLLGMAWLAKCKDLSTKVQRGTNPLMVPMTVRCEPWCYLEGHDQTVVGDCQH